MGPAAGAPEAREPPGVPGPACVRCLSSPCLLSREASFSQLERGVQRCYDAPRDTQLKDARPSSKPTTLVILELLGTETTKGEFTPPFSAIRRFKQTNKQKQNPHKLFTHMRGNRCTLSPGTAFANTAGWPKGWLRCSGVCLTSWLKKAPAVKETARTALNQLCDFYWWATTLYS